MTAECPDLTPRALGRDEFRALVAALTTALGEAQAVPQLLDGVQARKYVGLSKSGWHRARSAGLLPIPIYLVGSGDRYRKVDLDRFIERLKPRRIRHKRETGE